MRDAVEMHTASMRKELESREQCASDGFVRRMWLVGLMDASIDSVYILVRARRQKGWFLCVENENLERLG